MTRLFPHRLRLGGAFRLLLIASTALGAQPASSVRPPSVVYHLQVENDAFNPFGGDRSYTQGLRITSEWTPVKESGLFRLIDRLSGLRLHTGGVACVDSARGYAVDASGCLRLSIGAYQTMFTPDSIRLTVPPQNQRPYAGVAGFAVRSLVLRGRMSDIREIRIGLLGPASNAEATQNLAHWSFSAGARKVNGWATQIRNFPDISVRQIRRWQALRICGFSLADSRCANDERPRYADISVGYDAFLGTTGVRIGFVPTLRFGYNVDEATYPDRETPTFIAQVQAAKQRRLFFGATALDSLALKEQAARSVRTWRDRWSGKVSLYAVAEFHPRWVPYNAMLSGTPYDQRSNVEPYQTVAEASIGVALRIVGLSVSVLNVSRTPEFPGDVGQPYSMVRFSWRP